MIAFATWFGTALSRLNDQRLRRRKHNPAKCRWCKAGH